MSRLFDSENGDKVCLARLPFDPCLRNSASGSPRWGSRRPATTRCWLPD